jgi:hypothetical protein
MPTDKPDLTKLADAVEQACIDAYAAPGDWHAALVRLAESASEWSAARRAARAGYREALLSREALRLLAHTQRLDDLVRSEHDLYCEEACAALAVDLAALLKEPT